MLKKYWCYQYRETHMPWVICAKVTFPRGNSKKKTIAFDVYCEPIENDAHVLRIQAQRYDDQDIAIGAVTSFISCVSNLTQGDREQIASFVSSILTKE